MDLLSNDWFFWLVLFLLGLGIGFLLGRNNNSDLKRQNQLSKQLQTAHTEMAEYKEQVNLHFADTAAAVNQLTDSYRSVHEQLAKGAQSLCDDPDTASSLETIAGPAESAIEHQIEPAATIRPPMDYAPNSSKEHGTLDERYGLKPKPEATAPPAYDIPVTPASTN
jgi:uncharacterized membrane-anchored protein YhcB (DUF1043 family)|tara:strand:- start:1910 stop:2407 length:498 start_codon:yes stop_codon:yes gene_type:complete